MRQQSALAISKKKLLVDLANLDFTNTIFINGHGGDSAFLAPSPLESLADLIIDRKLKFLSNKLKALAIQ
jgi:hypothetical protein